MATILNTTKPDLDLQFRIRSSTEELKILEEITTQVVELLTEKLSVSLVEKNVNVNRSLEKKLLSVTVRLGPRI